MKKLCFKEISVVITALALIFSICAFVILNNSSVAWFSNNTNVSAGGFGVSTSGASNVSATLKSYPVSDIIGNTFTVDFTKESYSLPAHDPNSITYLEVEQALVIELRVVSETASTVNIHLSSSTNASSILGTEVPDTLEVNNYISNCIRIRSAVSRTDVNVTAESEENAKSHVDVSGGIAEKQSEIFLLSSKIGSGETVFYFIIEYNYTLLEHISKIMFDSHMGKNKVNYLNDIEFIIYS